MKMEKRVWRNLPDEIALNIIARLLPRRSLYRLRSVWKEWNDMLSSYAATQRMYPNIHLSHTSSFLFQCEIVTTYSASIVFESEVESTHTYTWVMEVNGDFYQASDDFYKIELACNRMFCFLPDDETKCICDEKKREQWTKICTGFTEFYGLGFDSRTEKFVMVRSNDTQRIDVYDSSSSNSWILGEFTVGDSEFWPSWNGVYHRGRFYWLDHGSGNGGVVELNVSERRWTKILPPKDAIYRRSEYTYSDYRDPDGQDIMYSIASRYWELVGCDAGELILIEREYGFVWKLENGEENINSKRWCRVDICLPNQFRRISVNNSGWIVAVGLDDIFAYDGSRRLVRKFPMEEVDPRLGNAIVEGFEWDWCVLPFECTYIWWPW